MKNANITVAKVLAFPVVLLAALLILLSLPFWPPVYLIGRWHQDIESVEGVWPLMLGGLGIATFFGVIYIASAIWPFFMALAYLYNELYYTIFKPTGESQCELP